MDIVSIDKAGRLLIPQDIRRRAKIDDKNKLLIIDVENDTIVIKKIDKDEIARRLKEELKGVDIDKIVKKVRAELNEKIKKEIVFD